MEHKSKCENNPISALLYYPIKSLVYCGALRFISDHGDIDFDDDLNSDNLSRMKFMPIDNEIAERPQNLKNPPLFVVFLKAIDAISMNSVIECHVFVLGAAKTAMKLVECCQKAFNCSKVTVNDFNKKYGNCPVIYSMSSSYGANSTASINTSAGRISVKIPDTNSRMSGFFYGTEDTPIEIWLLFDASDSRSLTSSSQIIGNGRESGNNSKSSMVSNDRNRRTISRESVKNEQLYSEKRRTPHSTRIDEDDIRQQNPYERNENLLKVEKRLDPVTGENIYVRYLLQDEANNNQTSSSKLSNNYRRSSSNNIVNSISNNRIYDVDLNVYGDKIDMDKNAEQMQQQLYIRQEKTPSPIIIEQYVKKKAPQV
jgi:hypothetical protein